MLTFSFKISTLESIPKYAISRSILPGRERGLVTTLLRRFSTQPSFLYHPPRHSFHPSYVHNCPPTLPRNLAPFFPAPCTRNHPLPSCLYSLARISVRGIKREREREGGRQTFRARRERERNADKDAVREESLENSHVLVNFEQPTSRHPLACLFLFSFVHVA